MNAGEWFKRDSIAVCLVQNSRKLWELLFVDESIGDPLGVMEFSEKSSAEHFLDRMGFQPEEA